VVQDVFVKAYFSLKSFREDSSFRTWITRIAINRTRDERKKQSHKIALNDEISQESFEQMSGYLNQPEQEENPPHYTETVGRLVTDAVASLPERLRMVATLKDMEGLSYQQVSQVLGCSVGTVKSRHARARARLRQLLTAHAPELLRR
jgi:RNA polymerase sigma-70 factor (ECF subfamily)